MLDKEANVMVILPPPPPKKTPKNFPELNEECINLGRTSTKRK